MHLIISLAQIDVALGEPDRNLTTIKVMAAEAARRGSDIVVFPELWSTGYDLENAAIHATPVDRGIFAETAELSRQYGIHIVGSCLSELGEGRYGNTAVFYNHKGLELGVYTKIHLFRLMDEDQYLVPGDHLTFVESRWGSLGLAICYDLRFPEIFRSYATAGAKMVLLPSEWPHPRLEHWRALIRARAIENQMFVIACNRVGVSKETSFCGHSAIIDPWGETVIEGGESPTLLTAGIDLDRVDEIREKIPVLSDRRPDIYLREIK